MQDIFSAPQHVLSAGDDLRMVRYVQYEDTERACLSLDHSILSLVLKGRKHLYHTGGKVEIGPGEGFFAARGNYLRTERRGNGPGGYVTLVIRCSDAFLASLLLPSEPVSASLDPVMLLRQDPLIDDLVAQLSHYFDRFYEKPRLETVLPLKIRELLTLLATAPANKGFSTLLRKGPTAPSDPLHALMEAHYKEPLTLEQWAFLAGQSLSSFKRKFETVYGMPPRRWIQQRRLQEAHLLLTDARYNVTEVCYETGFQNLAHFIHAFKERYGITPKQRQLAPEPPAILFGR
ncbi:helix-turn-helix transcriptional regulator [Dinghuibacter silviterrae]|uniref:AraC family transcriptional regulator n=1 Tax=Dinghuibacter silviterrae TaxID=1539049 RepID=A0A4R8DG18_9BACT|nr:helix-turn-helix transcriptional regulator [Dinghuibacter silviterrae]TDW96397.1 AraC family transcriptional regulator [Dinghuibacter silviterrae]